MTNFHNSTMNWQWLLSLGRGEMVWVSHAVQYNMTWFLVGRFWNTKEPCQNQTPYWVCRENEPAKWFWRFAYSPRWILRACKLVCGGGKSPFKGSSGSFQYYPLRQSVSIRKTRIPLWAEKVLGGEDKEDPARMIFKIFNNLYGTNPASHNGLQLLFQYQGHCWFSQPHPWSSTPWPPGLAELLHHSETHGIW